MGMARKCEFEDRVEVARVQRIPPHSSVSFRTVDRSLSLYERRTGGEKAAIVDGSHNIK